MTIKVKSITWLKIVSSQRILLVMELTIVWLTELFAFPGDCEGERLFHPLFAIFIITRAPCFPLDFPRSSKRTQREENGEVYDEAFPSACSFTHELLNCASSEVSEVFFPCLRTSFSLYVDIVIHEIWIMYTTWLAPAHTESRKSCSLERWRHWWLFRLRQWVRARQKQKFFLLSLSSFPSHWAWKGTRRRRANL